jgi:hypothetical protein
VKSFFSNDCSNPTIITYQEPTVRCREEIDLLGSTFKSTQCLNGTGLDTGAASQTTVSAAFTIAVLLATVSIFYSF